MLIKEKRAFVKGAVLFVSFFVVLLLMFSPLFGGKNALEASDDLFNSMSKGSTYYIPDLIKKNESYKGASVSLSIKLKDTQMAQKASKLLTTAGATVKEDGTQLSVSGDLGRLLEASLKDSDAMFNNREAEVTARYGLPGKEALFVWWNVFTEIDRDLSRQKRFKEAKWVSDVVKKGVETGYNFFGIAPQTVGSRAGILTFSLIFYVIYTLWWGVAIMFLFEGVGLELKAGAKKEM